MLEEKIPFGLGIVNDYSLRRKTSKRLETGYIARSAEVTEVGAESREQIPQTFSTAVNLRC